MSSLPWVDEHRLRVDATGERVWQEVERLARGLSSRTAPAAFAALWQLQPRTAFTLVEREPARRHLVLRGQHRFSRYELVFDVQGDPDGIYVRALTFAEFPGLAGRTYRALVIGSGGHRLVVRRMLRRIARAACRPA